MAAQKKILVVEDNELNRTMLVGILASAEYQALEAENGQAALSILADYEEEISLILLDIIMPVMDGYTFLSVVKTNPAYASIPVIVTTQSDAEADEVAVLAHGATDFIAKPYKPQVILHRIASIINLRETAAMINQFQYDRLTGLYSKAFFCQKVREILQQNPERDYDIICSDIENFKLINDVFGLQAGDRLLCGIAELYSQWVGSQGICGRFNADQFACLFPRPAEYPESLFQELDTRIRALSPSNRASMKWGIYAVEDRSLSVEQMCDRAFLAVNGIKRQFGKYMAAYDDALRGKLLREQTITDSMESALAEAQFQVYLQPKYRIQDDRLCGAEALVRWTHPELGPQSPGEFIPLFEKNGFITRLDQYVWERSCAILRQLDEKGYPPIPISVNISRADIYNADISDILVRILEKYRLPPARLHLEITESAYTETPDQLLETVNHLRGMGFVIEMDDFGSGYSSLNMLNRMPIDILKLDMEFIQSETSKPISGGILRFIMELADSMGLSVVAEGVETREQLERLREAGCEYVQGYYFARPMPPEAFEQLLASQPVAEEAAGTNFQKTPARVRMLLVADEDPACRARVRDSFSESYQVLESADAGSAWESVCANRESLAAVILSLTLPDSGGFWLLEKLQREKDTWGLPIITAAPAALNLEEKALEQGADDYMNKPYSQNVLRRRTLRAMGIAAMRSREQLLQDAAYQDYLTGLLNRRGLHTAAAMMRDKDAPAAVYLFDVDDLKRTNDTRGHTAGDELLRGFALRLRAHTRETDIISRYGGDEFVVILKQVGSAENAMRKGREICQAVTQDCFGTELPVFCSVGVTLWDLSFPLDAAIGRADEALYHAKREKKGSCRLWEERI